MRPLIQSKDDVDRLRAEASRWVGTPWIMNGAIKGHGVACHRVASEVLIAIGHKHPQVPGPWKARKEGSITTAMVSWLNGAAPYFARVGGEIYLPGDVIVVDTGIGHIALVVDFNTALHTWKDGGTQFQHIRAANAPILGGWRPMTV